jgi:translation initiation factor IF-1
LAVNPHRGPGRQPSGNAKSSAENLSLRTAEDGLKDLFEGSGFVTGANAVAAVFFYMSSEEPIELEGIIRTVLPGTMFRVMLDNQHEVLAHISGKMRKHFVRLTVGDRVRIEMSPYDLTKARITFRLR